MGRALAVVSFFIALCAAGTAQAQWTEGKHYELVQPAQVTDVPTGKVEIVEVFSYGCPGCNAFFPMMNRIKAALPAQTQVRYVPASWIPAENWVVFQRAFLTAQSLGLVDRTHDAMFDAIWKTGELSVVDQQTGKLKKNMPTIEQVAKFYARVGKIKAEDFLAIANSFSISAAMKNADAKIKAYKASSTPTIVVNGKYRVTPSTVGTEQQLIELVRWLVIKETRP